MPIATLPPIEEMSEEEILQADEIVRCDESPDYFVNKFCFLLDPNKAKIPFALYDYQIGVLEKFVLNRFNIILKARQLGISWLVAAYSLWLAIFHPGKSVLFISIKDETASELLDKVKFIFDQLPDWMKPEVYKRNETILWFGVQMPDGRIRGLNSIIKSIPTSKEAGRSKSLSLLIMDEAAFIRWSEDIHTSAYPTLSNSGNAIYLSSANGMGNLFYRLWTEAVSGGNSFVTTFLPWSVYPGRDAVWYEQKRRDMSSWQLNQEFPSSPDEAFVQSGNPVFDLQDIRKQENNIINMPITGWQIYKEIKPGMALSIAVDPSEGKVGGDPSAVEIIEATTGEQIAELDGFYRPDILAQKVNLFVNEKIKGKCKYLITVERNNHGHAVLLEFKHLGTKNLYHDKMPIRRTDGDPGWLTTTASKQMIIDALEEAIRNNETTIHGRALIDELIIYAREDNGSTNAPEGYHDDRIMAYAMAWWNKRYALRSVAEGAGYAA